MAEIVILDAGDASPEDLKRGCTAAEKLILSRGYTVDLAYRAVLARSSNKTFERRIAKAWDDAEDAAFAAAFGDIDDWPDDAVLGLAGVQ